MNSQDHPAAAQTFDAVDREVLDYWFREPDRSPSRTSPVGARIATAGLVPERGLAYSTPSAYIANLVLSAIRHRLPGEDEPTNTAQISQPSSQNTQNYPSRTIDLLPRFLCSLNWESRGPEVCWPVDYYAAWLPGYRRWVVTGSTAMPEFWGIYDVALGWFDDGEEVLEGARRVLTADWRTATKLYSPLASDFLRKPGVVDGEVAERWLAEIRPTSAE